MCSVEPKSPIRTETHGGFRLWRGNLSLKSDCGVEMRIPAGGKADEMHPRYLSDPAYPELESSHVIIEKAK